VTDGQTNSGHITYRASIAPRGKNDAITLLLVYKQRYARCL